jgi:gamma-aminobutyric acid type B receptor
VIFSALFSKTWRVNRLFHAKVRHARIQVTEKDVLAPFAVLLTSNIVVLICWTVIDPLTYIRQEHDGTDYWNRVISTYGACRSDNAVAYLVPLAVINFSVIAIACYQAVQARNIESEFAEAKYIGLAVTSLFQAFVTGVPVVVVVRDMPKAYYLVLTLMIFLVCVAVLALIFIPKVLMERKYAGKSEREQKSMFRSKISGEFSSRISYGAPPSSSRAAEVGDTESLPRAASSEYFSGPPSSPEQEDDDDDVDDDGAANVAQEESCTEDMSISARR